MEVETGRVGRTHTQLSSTHLFHPKTRVGVAVQKRRQAAASTSHYVCGALLPGALSTWRPSTGHDLHMFTRATLNGTRGSGIGIPS